MAGFVPSRPGGRSRRPPNGGPTLSRRRPRGRPLPRRRGVRAGGPPAWLALLLLPLAGVVWAYVPVAALTTRVPPAHRPAAVAGLPWLTTAGGRIVDGDGRAVLLRGFNSDALLEPENRHAVLDETDASDMQRSGFDVVRLPVAWSRLEPSRGVWDAAYLDEVAHTVAMVNAHGMYAVLDMHFLDWGPRFGGSGAPRWAALPAVPDLQWWPWESWRKHLSPAQNAATTYFWLSPDWQADFLAAWRHVAERFAGDSGVAGYDLYNEPHPLPIPPRLFEQHWMWPLYARTIDAIGAVDPNHLFIVEGVLFGDGGTTVVPLQAPDLVYSPHIYTGSLVPPAFDGDPSRIRAHVADQAAEARAVPAPMWVGELGIDHAQARSDQWADAILDAYDDLQAGWAWWQWRESSGWGVRDAGGGNLDIAKLRHLARPYVVVSPSWVHGGRGDGVAGRLEVRVDGARDTGPVEVAWPALTLGTPRASGSCLASSSWDPATARLALILVPQATCTVVVVRG